MSGTHARPPGPGRAVLVLAALGVVPPVLILAPFLPSTVPTGRAPVSVPDATASTSPTAHPVGCTDRCGARLHRIRRRSEP